MSAVPGGRLGGWLPGAAGDQIPFGEDERDLGVDVMGRAGGRLARGPRPGSPRRPPLAGQVAGEIRAHQLAGDAMSALFSDSCRPACYLRAAHPVLQGHRSTGLLNITAVR
jgi:hypothetical protein